MNKIYLLSFILPLICFGQIKQNLTNIGIQVSTPCSLYNNSVFKQMADDLKVADALVCASNKNDPNRIAIYNINAYYHQGGAKAFMLDYASNLKNSGIHYEGVVVQGIPCIEYSFMQNGIPVKALVFYRNGKAFLLQVTTRNNLNQAYTNLKKSLRKLY